MIKKLKIILIAVLSIAIFTAVLIAQKPKTSNEHLFIETDFGTIEIAFLRNWQTKAFITELFCIE